MNGRGVVAVRGAGKKGVSVKVAITGATGVIGRAAVRRLVAEGHEVVGLARTPAKAGLLESLGARARPADMFDPESLVRLVEGCDAVVNLATHIPVGLAGVLPGAWRQNDRLRTVGVRNVVDAARTVGVRRIVQESVSYLYADQGEEWVTEESPLMITRATEPASVAESLVQEYACRSRAGVVLRLGTIVGDDGLTRYWLRSAQHGGPVAAGDPRGWVHLVHTDDLGSAVLAALGVTSGVYNVGAEPVRREELVLGYAEAVGRSSAATMGPWLRRLAGARLEPLTRSLRVSAEHFTAQTGWVPRRRDFDASWFDVVTEEHRAAR